MDMRIEYHVDTQESVGGNTLFPKEGTFNFVRWDSDVTGSLGVVIGLSNMVTKEIATKERRKHTRHTYSANLRFRRDDGKALPARSVDISSGGMLLNVLAYQDLFSGQTITLDLDADDVLDTFPDVYLPCSHDLQATIVRIERGRLSSNGYMSIAVQFNYEQNANDTAYFV